MLVLNLSQRMPFQSTHPVRGGTLPSLCPFYYYRISIHPPREGWDGKQILPVSILSNFNPPTP